MALVHERLEILVVDLLLLVRQIKEGIVHLVELLLVKLIAELLQAMLQRGVARTRGEHDLGLTGADLFRVDDLIGVALLQHAVLMDAGGMRERVGTDDSLVHLHVDAGDGRNQAGSLEELAGVDVGVGVKLLTVHLDAHDHFLHGRVARTLAQAVDGALDLGCAVFNARQRQGRGHAQVVVAMHRHGDVLDAANVLHEVPDATAELVGQAVTGGIGDVHDGCAGVDNGLDNLRQERIVGTTGVLGIELDVLDIAFRMLDGGHRTLDALVLGDAELVAQVARAHAEARVDAGALGVLERVGRRVDVLLHRAREAADDRLVARQLGDAAHALEVAGAGNGETRFDDIDVQT